jgi:hypothetical protein
MPFSSSLSSRPRPSVSALFAGLLDTLEPADALVNEVVEVGLDSEDVVITRYELPKGA